MSRAGVIQRLDFLAVDDVLTPSSRARWLCDCLQGERIGTYDGHNGAVWSLDVTWNSEFLVTGSADQSVKLWNVETGEELHHWDHAGPVRTVAWAEGDKEFLTVTDPYAGKPAVIRIYEFTGDPETQPREPRLEIISEKEMGARTKVTQAAWVKLNGVIVTSTESGALRTYDADTGEMLQEVRDHKNTVRSFALNREKTVILTASADNTARLYDVRDLNVCMKEYTTDRPINSCAISPIKDHVMLGGGQDAADVTVTDASSGKMDVRIMHSVFGVELARVKGHFGPVNSVDFHPSGYGFASGGEDGYIRLHMFDSDYDTLGDALEPDDAKIEELRRVIESADRTALPELPAADDDDASGGAGGPGGKGAKGRGGAEESKA